MGAETVVTVAAVGLVVSTVAISLIGITLKLYKVDSTLGRIHGGVDSIGRRTQPVGPVLGEIAGGTRSIADALTALVALATGTGEAAVTTSMSDAVADARTRHLEPATASAEAERVGQSRRRRRAERVVAGREAGRGSMQEAVARAREAVASGLPS